MKNLLLGNWNLFSCGYPKTDILFVLVWFVYLIHKGAAFIACPMASDQIWTNASIEIPVKQKTKGFLDVFKGMQYRKGALV